MSIWLDWNRNLRHFFALHTLRDPVMVRLRTPGREIGWSIFRVFYIFLILCLRQWDDSRIPCWCDGHASENPYHTLFLLSTSPWGRSAFIIEIDAVHHDDWGVYNKMCVDAYIYHYLRKGVVGNGCGCTQFCVHFWRRPVEGSDRGRLTRFKQESAPFFALYQMRLSA